MGLFGPLGDIIVNKTKNVVSQGLLGAKQNIGDAYRTLNHYTDPVEGIKAITPMIENKFPRVGAALKQGTDYIDNLREKVRNFRFRNTNPPLVPTKAPTATTTKAPTKSPDLKHKVRNEVRRLLESKRLTPEEYYQLHNGKQYKKKAKILMDD